jgi:2-phospho-L-lactate guanylyltransferase
MLDWAVVVPVRGPREDEDEGERALADAVARDTLEAVAASTAVALLVVVTDDERLATDLALPLAATVHVQRGSGLNRGIAEALAAIEDCREACGRAVLMGDLPALTARDLDTALATAGEHALAAAPDAEGSGTVLLSGHPGIPLLPAFGTGSAVRHRRLGHTAIRVPDGVRTDVDGPAGLAAALRLGVGARTAALARLLEAPSSASRSRFGLAVG